MNNFHLWLIIFFIKNSKNFAPIQCCKWINVSWSEQLSLSVIAGIDILPGPQAGWKDEEKHPTKSVIHVLLSKTLWDSSNSYHYCEQESLFPQQYVLPRPP